MTIRFSAVWAGLIVGLIVGLAHAQTTQPVTKPATKPVTTPAATLADSHEAIIKDALVQFKAVAKTLESATDEASAKVAAETLAPVVLKVTEIKMRAKVIGEPKGKLGDELMAKYKDDFEATAKAMEKEIKRVKENEAVLKVLKKPLTDLDMLGGGSGGSGKGG